MVASRGSEIKDQMVGIEGNIPHTLFTDCRDAVNIINEYSGFYSPSSA